MTDPEFDHEVARVERLHDTWCSAMGLRGDWHITVHYFRQPLDVRPVGDRLRPPECESVKYGRVMQILCQWEYQTADIEVNCLLAALLNDDDLTEYFLHELGHLLVSGLTTLHAGQSHKVSHAWYLLEEYTATRLAWAFKWLADKVWRDGLDGVYRHAEHPASTQAEQAESRQEEEPGEGDLRERGGQPEGRAPRQGSDAEREGRPPLTPD